MYVWECYYINIYSFKIGNLIRTMTPSKPLEYHAKYSFSFLVKCCGLIASVLTVRRKQKSVVEMYSWIRRCADGKMLRCHFFRRQCTCGPSLKVRRANNWSRILTYESIDAQMHFHTARLHTSGDWYNCVLTSGDVRTQQAHCFLVCREENLLLRLLKCFFWPVMEEKHVLKRPMSLTGIKVQTWQVYILRL